MISTIIHLFSSRNNIRDYFILVGSFSNFLAVNSKQKETSNLKGVRRYNFSKPNKPPSIRRIVVVLNMLLPFSVEHKFGVIVYWFWSGQRKFCGWSWKKGNQNSSYFLHGWSFSWWQQRHRPSDGGGPSSVPAVPSVIVDFCGCERPRVKRDWE